jgi:hypothetical protein
MIHRFDRKRKQDLMVEEVAGGDWVMDSASVRRD